MQGSAIASGTGLWTIVMGAVPDGTHTYTVRPSTRHRTRAPRRRGPYASTPALPDTTLTGGPSGPTNDTTPTFSFTSEPGATFECSVDGAAFAACPAPFTTPALGAGCAHVRACARSTPPGTATTPPPPATSPSTRPSPTRRSRRSRRRPTTARPRSRFASEAGATFQCSLDGAAFAACASPLTTALLADGEHTFAVRARDAAGNVDATPATQTFEIDTGLPDTTIDDGPDRRDQRRHADVPLQLRRARRRSSAASTAPRSPPARRR